MPNFLSAIDERFNKILAKVDKGVTRKDILKLKTFIIDIYEKDNLIDLVEINNSMKIVDFDLSSIDN